MTVELIDIVELASLATENSVLQFLRAFPGRLAALRPNIFIKFRPANMPQSLR